MQLEIADIATNEKKKLQGFKVGGIFPFYLKYIRTGVHIKLCKIQEQIHRISPNEPTINDFYNSEIQEKAIPLINKYCVTALVNDRPFAWFFRKLLYMKIKTCGHFHILNLYVTIRKLNEPAFFLSYWQLIKQTDNTLLKEVEHS
jgi:hypothetical protein